MTDCYDWRVGGATTDGIYRISPPGFDPFDVWCDMTTEGGGWTVFQKRVNNGTVFWNRVWEEYKNGFGDGFDRNYWLGLDRLHVLSTKDFGVILRIDIHGNRCHAPDYPNCDPNFGPFAYYYGEWQSFSIENEANGYRLHVSSFLEGNMSTANEEHLMNQNNNAKFTTIDVNNDDSPTNCAGIRDQLGAWWHKQCENIFLNGIYYPPRTETGFFFLNFADEQFHDNVIPNRSEMKLRRNG